MVNFLMDSNLTNEQMEHVDIIRNSTEGLRDLINDILDLSKVEAGMIRLDLEWLHLRSVIEEVNDIMFALALDKGLELNYIVDPDVPPMLKGDRFRIRQILLNIVGNAIKFTEHGEVVVRCEVLKSGDGQISRVGLSENQIVLSFQVIDTGRGFDEEQSKALFKRFSQVHEHDKQVPGTGLGLAISMQLVILHGGTMVATSHPGSKGSVFTFTVKCGISIRWRQAADIREFFRRLPTYEDPVAQQDVPESDAGGLARAQALLLLSNTPSPLITQSPHRILRQL